MMPRPSTTFPSLRGRGLIPISVKEATVSTSWKGCYVMKRDRDYGDQAGPLPPTSSLRRRRWIRRLVIRSRSRTLGFGSYRSSRRALIGRTAAADDSLCDDQSTTG